MIDKDFFVRITYHVNTSHLPTYYMSLFVCGVLITYLVIIFCILYLIRPLNDFLRTLADFVAYHKLQYPISHFMRQLNILN